MFRKGYIKQKIMQKEYVIPNYVAPTESKRKTLRICENIYRALNFLPCLARRLLAEVTAGGHNSTNILFVSDLAMENEDQWFKDPFQKCGVQVALAILAYSMLIVSTSKLQMRDGFLNCMVQFIVTTIFTAVIVFFVVFRRIAGLFTGMFGMSVNIFVTLITDVCTVFRASLGFLPKKRYADHPYTGSTEPTMGKVGVFITNFLAFVFVCFLVYAACGLMRDQVFRHPDALNMPVPEEFSWFTALQYRFGHVMFNDFENSRFDFSAKYAVTCNMIAALCVAWDIFALFMASFGKSKRFRESNIYPSSLRFETEEEEKERIRKKKKKDAAWFETAKKHGWID